MTGTGDLAAMTTPHPRGLVGVIGGVGPMATAYFMQRVVALTDANLDQDHVDMVVFNHATIPDRTAYILDPSKKDPAPILAADARRLQDFGADMLVMPCNTAHYFTEQVVNAVTIPLVSIIDCTVAAAENRIPGLERVGLLATEGTVASGVYQQAFAARGLSTVVPSLDDQALINEIIYGQIKAGLPSDVATLRKVTARLQQAGATVVVLGCTELSVMAVDHHLLEDSTFVDSMDQLVRATIRNSGHQVRPGA